MDRLTRLKQEIDEETRPPEPPRLRLEMGNCYLVKEKKPIRSFMIFKNGLAQNMRGMCVSTSPPAHLNMPHSVPTLWLSTVKTQGTYDPANLQKLYHEISIFAEANKETLVLLDGLETMILNSEFHKVQKFLDSMNVLMVSTKSLCLIPINPEALEPKEFAYLERVLNVVE